MDVKQVNDRLNNLPDIVGDFHGAVSDTVRRSVDGTFSVVGDLEKQTIYRVAQVETSLSQYISVLYLDAYHHVNRGYYHASPALMAILSAIYYAAAAIVKVVTAVLSSEAFKIIMSVHKITAALWPKYKYAVDKIFKSVSDAAKKIGMGAGGIQHLINLTGKTSGFLGGVFGWDWDMTKTNFYERSIEMTGTVTRQMSLLAQDPGKWLMEYAAMGVKDDKEKTDKWWKGVQEWLDTQLSGIEDVANQVGDISQGLVDLQASLPDFVAQYIPDSVWDGISDLNYTINHDIKNDLISVRYWVKEIDENLDGYGKKLSDLSGKIQKPGSLMLGVDDLPGYARKQQEGYIDDVSSRIFNEEVFQDTSDMEETYDELASIADAMTAPTPEPTLYTIESVAGRTRPGITIEPHETWFVGDY